MMGARILVGMYRSPTVFLRKSFYSVWERIVGPEWVLGNDFWDEVLLCWRGVPFWECCSAKKVALLGDSSLARGCGLLGEMLPPGGIFSGLFPEEVSPKGVSYPVPPGAESVPIVSPLGGFIPPPDFPGRVLRLSKAPPFGIWGFCDVPSSAFWVRVGFNLGAFLVTRFLSWGIRGGLLKGFMDWP